jgi:hypothetical protein
MANPDFAVLWSAGDPAIPEEWCVLGNHPCGLQPVEKLKEATLVKFRVKVPRGCEV